MKKNLKIILIIFCYVINVNYIFPNTNYYRDYNLIYSYNYDIENSTENCRTAYKLLNDFYFRIINPCIGNEIIKSILGGFWRFLTTWSGMAWPHEFGHMLRAYQVGGRFGIVKVTFPMIYGDMSIPDTCPIEYHLLALNGGFEGNYITYNNIQRDLYINGSLYNDELALAFGNRIMFPLYSLFFVWVDPAKVETRDPVIGDPATFSKLVWQFRGKTIIISNNVVNPDLVSYYWTSIILSMIWNLIDINFYTEASTFFASEYEGKNSFYLIGDNYNGWNYGTLINFAPMGIELYFNNYIKFMNKLNILSIRFTYPLDSFGIGIYFSDIITFFNFKLDLNLDFWNQYYYGLGIGVITEIKYNIFDNISIHTKIGWKSDGYMIGLTTKNSPIFSLGVKYKL